MVPGYFDDDTTWFARQTPSYSGEDDYINIGTSLDDQNIDNYSIQWTGYSYHLLNGNYMFRATSDDASFTAVRFKCIESNLLQQTL
jgi:hypothetical protein